LHTEEIVVYSETPIRMSLPPKPIYKSVTAAGAFEVSGLALGLGIGILLGDKFRKPARRVAAAGLVTAGLVASVPFIYDFVARQLKHSGSARSMTHRLATIREDSGIQDEAQAF
jgi:hypothetical protein